MCVETFIGCLKLQQVASFNGIQVEFHVQAGESLIQRGRNRMVADFMRTDSTHMMFIDADIEFEAEDIISMIKLDREIVCAGYPRKHILWDQVELAVKQGRNPRTAGSSLVYDAAIDESVQNNGDGTATFEVVDGCLAIRHAATGFLLMKREALTKMMAHYMDETMYYDDSIGDSHGRVVFSLFDCGIVGGRYLSEDYLFSHRWREMGGKIWMYLPCVLKHVGRHVYEASITDQMKPVEGASEQCDIPTLDDGDPQKGFHLYRYDWAAKVLGKDNGEQRHSIANAACGTNYGSRILEPCAYSVVGFDRSEECAELNRRREYGKMEVIDIESRSFFERVRDFDTVVSLETVEHLKNPGRWLSELRDAGVGELVLSVPIVPTKWMNPYHLHDFTEEGFVQMVESAGYKIVTSEKQAEFKPDSVLLVHARRSA